MTRRRQNINDILAAAALAEMDGPESLGFTRKIGDLSKELEKEFIVVTFAEAADYEDIDPSILQKRPMTPSRPDECQFGDNESCFTEGR